MSSSFVSLPPTPQALRLDPSKHVNYTLGMLLGVEDFRQEHAYVMGHLEATARGALGYGTLNGLALSITVDARGPRVQVTAGSALLPNGKLVCVSPAQCAYINDWLTANQAQALATILSPPNLLPLYLVLCYRDCPVELVPIPGEPCRTEDELFAPSRLADDFLLEFRTEPPEQLEEDGIREFAEWLDAMVIVQGGAAMVDLEALELAIVGSLPTSQQVEASGLQLSVGSPVAPITVSPAQAPELFATLLRIWVTRIRPLVHAPCRGGSSCDCETSVEPSWDDCLLLGRFNVPVINVGPGINLRVDDTQTVGIDESRRPILPSLRLVAQLQTQLAWS